MSINVQLNRTKLVYYTHKTCKLLNFGNSILKKMAALKTPCYIRPHTDPLMPPLVHQWSHPSFFSDTMSVSWGHIPVKTRAVIQHRSFYGARHQTVFRLFIWSVASGTLSPLLPFHFRPPHCVTVIEKVGVTNSVRWLKRKLQLDMSGPWETWVATKLSNKTELTLFCLDDIKKSAS